MAPSFSGVWKLQTKYQYSSAFPIDLNTLPKSLIGGGYDGSAYTNQVQKILITNVSNAVDFGDLTVARGNSTGGGSSTRFVTAGGYASSHSNVIDYKEYASSGNLSDFGDLLATKLELGTIGNNDTRLVFAGGYGPSAYYNVIEYITIASTGNSIDFGDLTTVRHALSTGQIGNNVRGLNASGYNNSASATLNVIEYITIPTTGNSTDFGDLTATAVSVAACSSSTRGVFMGGRSGIFGGDSTRNVIQYVTIASKGNATDFGDLNVSVFRSQSVSNSTKGLNAGGSTDGGGTQTNVIDQITIASTGNATDFADLATAISTGSSGCAAHPAVQSADFSPTAIGLLAGGYPESIIESVDINTDGSSSLFGDLSQSRGFSFGGASNTTRGIFFGGYDGSTAYNIIDYVTFGTRGKALDFGDTLNTVYGTSGISNSTRGVIGGGYGNASGFDDNSHHNVIQYITIASTGNSTDFGNLSVARSYAGAAASTTRGVFAGGFETSVKNTIDYITIASTGNATDFGDLSVARSRPLGASSNTRALFAGGYVSSASNIIDYVTIASTGNATDFGDLTTATQATSPLSDKTTALFRTSGDSVGAGAVDKVTIASTGNGADWGDIIAANTYQFSVSNSHGGLS